MPYVSFASVPGQEQTSSTLHGKDNVQSGITTRASANWVALGCSTFSMRVINVQRIEGSASPAASDGVYCGLIASALLLSAGGEEKDNLHII